MFFLQLLPIVLNCRTLFKQIQTIAHQIGNIIAEGHPTYGHQCYSKALAAAAGYPMGDVRPPLTRFDQLAEEGVERLEKIVPLMKNLDVLVEGMEVKTQ